MNERSIFLAALEKADSLERKAFLDDICGENTQLRAQIDALFRLHDNPGVFLETPLVDFGSLMTEELLSEESHIREFFESCDRPDRIGQFGPYEIVNEIGRGGMGVVFQAWDSKLCRVVALKVLNPELARNLQARKRFLREAKATASICNDHVVTIHAVEDTHRLPFLVMEYVQGQTLQNRIDEEGSLEVQETIRIAVQIAKGLAAAHAQGLVHRDIKPANILLENGVARVKITDFGLARTCDDGLLTHPGVLTGTPQYMSPEQADNQPVDSRSDLFSLGGVMYAMCAGISPFAAGSVVATLKRICEEAPRDLHEVRPDVPEWLAGVIKLLLEKAPDDRISSAPEVIDLLQEGLCSSRLTKVIPTKTNTRRSFSETRLLKRVLATGGLLALMAVLAFYAVSRPWYPPPTELVLMGTDADDELLLVVTGPNSCAYQLNGGAMEQLSSVSFISFDGRKGNAKLILDFNGRSSFSVPVTFNGSGQSNPDPGDAVEIRGFPPGQGTANLSVHDSGPGGMRLLAKFDFDSAAQEILLTLNGVEHVKLAAPVADLEMVLPGGAGSATLGDDGPDTPDPDATRDLGYSYSHFGPGNHGVEFANPARSLTIRAPEGVGTVAVETLDAAWNADVTIRGNEVDGEIAFRSAIDLGSGDLVASAKTIPVFAPISTTGDGIVDLSAARSIDVHPGANLVTKNGTISLVANKANTGTGTFSGIDLNGCSITTVNGAVTLTGTGGDAGDANYGVVVRNHALVKPGGAGTVTVTGTGGHSSGQWQYGVNVTGNGSQITSSAGDVRVTGVGGGHGTARANTGVRVDGTSRISAGKLGKVTVTGAGGEGTGTESHGIHVGGSGMITSGGGDVFLDGRSGTGPGGAHSGVRVDLSARVTSGGSGKVTIRGTNRANGGGISAGVTLINNASVRSGTDGDVELLGQVTGESNSVTRGVVIEGATVTSAGNGLITIKGTGGRCSGNHNIGVLMQNGGAVVATGGGNVHIVGHGGGKEASEQNIGVWARQSARITTSKGGEISIEGTSGSTSGQENFGVNLAKQSRVHSQTGKIAIRGESKGSGPESHGVVLSDDGSVEAKSADILIIGVGSGPSGDGIHFWNTTPPEPPGQGNITLRGTAAGNGLDVSVSQ